MFKWNFPDFTASLCPLHLVIFLETTKRDVALSFSLPHQVLICIDKVHRNLLLSGLNSPSSASPMTDIPVY